MKLTLYVAFIAMVMALGVTACKKSTDSDVILELFSEGLKQPTSIANAGDGRLFVTELEGNIVILDSAGNDTGVFLDLSDKTIAEGEKGLLGLAFHPQYKSNGYFYINYIGEGDSTRIARFKVSDDDPNRADPQSEFTLLTLKQPFDNHNGGQLAFGPDGFLYIALGDGGSQGDPENRAQNRKVLFGKILRINVDAGNPYAIPSSNPFVQDSSALPEIWAYGLRNPWRFSFDTQSGDLWIADVGEEDVEEINLAEARTGGGFNYGWRCYEGDESFRPEGCDSSESFESPVYAYNHGVECTVIGGYVFRGKETSPYFGKYFFADFCSDQIWMLEKTSGGKWSAEEYGQFPGNNFATFGMDKEGEIYLAGYTTGRIYRLPL